MKVKSFLILMTWIAVISDYLLHPFYPQFFNLRFGISDPKQVGFYFASICVMIMVSFPFWAWVSKKIAPLRILILTQLAAGALALFCYYCHSYSVFWLVSLLMFFFKGSYLLVYPYILKLIAPKEHASTIGVLALVVHSGSILGAIGGGVTVDAFSPEHAFLIMCACDWLLMCMSFYLLNFRHGDFKHAKSTESNKQKSRKTAPSYLIKIGFTTFVLYSSDFLIRPFFSSYWEYMAVANSQSLAGVVYALSGLAAILALWANKKWKPSDKPSWMQIHLSLCILGLILQGSGHYAWVIIGRLIYGWAIFQSMVRFDQLLFASSHPESYALDYSKVHFFQNLGVLTASFASGILVEHYNLTAPFLVAVSGVALVVVLYYFLFMFRVTTNKQNTKSFNYEPKSSI